MLRAAIATLILCECGLAHTLKDCRGQTFGATKFGNLSAMSWHIHYNTNTTGQRLFYEAFMKEFYESKKFPFPPDTTVCPFGPNYGAASYPYVCSLEPPYEDWGADNVVFKGLRSQPNLGGQPWSGPQRAFFFPNKYIEEAWTWAKANRFHTDVLHHPNTGCMHDDHSVRALWSTEDPSSNPTIDIAQFPCNVPGTGCNDTLFGGPPACNCVDELPLPDDSPANSCGYCLPNGGYIEDLEFACTDFLLQVEYSHIKYYSGKVSCGNLFSEADIGGGIHIAPIVKYPLAKNGSLYTFIMMDPDADLPNNGSWPDVIIPGGHAPVRHWVVGNLDAASLRTGDFSSATTVSPFVGPSPPYGSHRYGQFLFEQLKKFHFEDFTGKSTVQWDYKGFLGKYALGDKPVASNWHITEHALPRSSQLDPGSQLEVFQV
jgi:phosphatidylethanolamine-binding protein (PEBP) family uncharacterized protein